MGTNLQKSALASAVDAARAAGALMRRNAGSDKKINAASQHDIKLELDVRCQRLIERKLHQALPQIEFLGEEGESANLSADYRWVVDPIDGTVNFTYGIPHACVSIALQRRDREVPAAAHPDSAYDTVLGVVYDPFCGELWTAVEGGPARLNGRVVRASQRKRLSEAVISIGFSKDRTSLELMLPALIRLVHRVRKVRIMGSAALALTYVASGRMDAYVEYGLSLWDIAAGGFIIERAGGEFWHQPTEGHHKFRIIASNGRLQQTLRPLI
jgi:myo-inositol-1(or 4)-monophosphatase